MLLSEDCLPLRDTIEGIFTQRPELIGAEAPPAAVALNLAPESWKAQRLALVRRAQWRKRALWAGGAAADFLGTQGDVWDTQWDMFLCLCGAIASLLVLSRWHDRQLGPALLAGK